VVERKVASLWRHPGLVRFARFGVVGASGVLVNMGVFWVGTVVVFAGLTESSRNVLAGALAVVVSILTNFLLNDAWTWRDRRRGGRRGWWQRLAKYVAVATIAGGVQVGVLWLLSIPLGVHELIANFVGIGAGVGINFVVNNVWTFRGDGGTSEVGPGADIAQVPAGAERPNEREAPRDRGADAAETGSES